MQESTVARPGIYEWYNHLDGLFPEEQVEFVRRVRKVWSNPRETGEDRKAAVRAVVDPSFPYLITSMQGVAQDLARLLTQDDVELRVVVCQVLGDLGDFGSPILEQLINALDDPEAIVRQEAIRAVVAVARTEQEDRRDRVAEQLMRMLRLPDEPVTQALAAQGLGELLAAPAAEELQALLEESPFPEARREAALALGALQERPEVLGELLSRQLFEDREAAVQALEQLGPKAGAFADDVAQRLHEPLLRIKALAALGAMGEVAAPYIPRILGYLRDADSEVRMTAVEALEKLHEFLTDDDRQAVEEDLLHHQDPRLRATGICMLSSLAMHQESLGKYAEVISKFTNDNEVKGLIRSPHVPIAMQQPDIAAVYCLGKLEAAGRDYAGDVAQICQDGGARTVRPVAIEVLGGMGTAGLEHTGALRRCLADADEAIVCAALFQLGKLGACGPLGGDVISAMIAATKNLDPSLRPEAILSLGFKDAPEQIVEALTSMVADSIDDPEIDNGLCFAAAEALGNVGQAVCSYPKALEALKACLASTHKGARRSAAQSLGAMKAMTLAENVAEKLTDYAEVRGAAALALGNMAEIGAEYQQEVALLLDSPLALLRKAACEALGKLAKDEQALNGDILDKLQDLSMDDLPCVRKAACDTYDEAC